MAVDLFHFEFLVGQLRRVNDEIKRTDDWYLLEIVAASIMDEWQSGRMVVSPDLTKAIAKEISATYKEERQRILDELKGLYDAFGQVYFGTDPETII